MTAKSTINDFLLKKVNLKIIWRCQKNESSIEMNMSNNFDD